ncbi:MAG: hypothetical protein L0Y71_14420 [Gemmataceae bacterium]|nr:hypothetical protein [Gemmataceae bacterium]
MFVMLPTAASGYEGRTLPAALKQRGIDPAFGTYRSFDVRENQFAVACLGRLRAKQATEALENIARQTNHQELRKLAQQALQAIRSSR